MGNTLRLFFPKAIINFYQNRSCPNLPKNELPSAVVVLSQPQYEVHYHKLYQLGGLDTARNITQSTHLLFFKTQIAKDFQITPLKCRACKQPSVTFAVKYLNISKKVFHHQDYMDRIVPLSPASKFKIKCNITPLNEKHGLQTTNWV